MKDLSKETLRRELTIDRAAKIDEDARTVELSFSSETPVERWFGSEVLAHDGKVRLDRMNTGAPLLINHDTDDQVGVIEKAYIDGDKGRAVVRFSKSARGEEIFQDVRDGIRRLVSVGYRIHETKTEKKSGGVEVIRVTDWEPLEISLVAVPADASVGVGRAAEKTQPTETQKTNLERNKTMSEVITEPKIEVREVPDPKAHEKGAAEGQKAERERISEINSIAGLYAGNSRVRELADKAIADGTPLPEFRAEALKALAKAPVVPTKSEQRDLAQFSIVRAIGGLLSGKGLDGIEAEMHEEGVREARANGVALQGNLCIPNLVLNHGRRDLTATGGTNGDQGGVTVPVVLGSIIDLLYAKMVLRGLGAQFLTGLTGNVDFPRMATGSSGLHKAENAALGESSPTFGKVTLRPNRFGTFIEISKQLLLQSNESVEALVRNDIATALALGMEAGALTGTGANDQPLGLLTYDGGFTSGISEVIGGTDGAAPSWAKVVELETAIANANADIGSLAYLTNPKVRGKMKTTPKVASTDSIMLWENNSSPINGYRAEVTTQVPSNLDKGSATGVCSAMVFGNWSELIVGMWGGLDIQANPYARDTEGLVRITAAAFYDTAVRRPQSFAALRDILTT
jgi:HK97 family phage major capsid protein/HK97 family phage prohead protease